MTKRDILLAEAERLYYIEQMTINGIAAKLNLNDKTVSAWKNEGDWETKRKQYLKSKLSFHEELYEFSKKLMNSINTDLASGEKVDQGRLYALAKILPLIIKVKEYEDFVAKKEEKFSNKGLTKDIVALIEEEVLGIRKEEFGQ